MQTLREQAIQYAQESGFKASVGKTDRNGNYTPYVNAIFKDVPVEWIEAVILKVQRDCVVEEKPVWYERLYNNLKSALTDRKDVL